MNTTEPSAIQLAGMAAEAEAEIKISGNAPFDMTNLIMYRPYAWPVKMRMA